MIDHALRRMRRHWRSNIAVLLCLALASALLVSFASYAQAVAKRELIQSLDEARPAERDLLITGTRYSFSDELSQRLEEILGRVLKDWLVIRHAWSPADQGPAAAGGEGQPVIALLDLYSFSSLAENVRVIQGRLPAQVRLREAEDSWRPPPIEAVIGLPAAERSGVGVGDRLTGSKTYHRLDIVGIVEPFDPRDDIWGEDLSAFEIAGHRPELPAGTVALPLIIDPVSMQSNYPERPVFLHEVAWRITLNRDLLSVAGADELYSDLINLQTQSATRRAAISTGLVQILADYLSRLSRVRMALFLVTAQASVFVLYALAVFTSFSVDRAQAELVTLSGRGASVWAIAQLFALEYLVLALPAALLLGPGLAQGALYGWGKLTGGALPIAMPGEAWSLSAAAVALGWGTLVVPIFFSARRAALGGGTVRARPAEGSAVQRRYLDLYLLAFGGLLYWQLNRTGSFVMERLAKTQLADPLLLVGPSLLLIAASMVALRILPPLLRLFARLARPVRGLVLPLGLLRLARDPRHPGRVVLLVSLTAGLVLFTRTFGDSLAYGQEAAARQLTGADLRVSLDGPADPSIDQLVRQPAVLALSSVFRGTAQTGDGRSLQLLAVDPDTFAQVAPEPADSDLRPIMAVLQAEDGAREADDAALPAVLSRSALPGGKSLGDQLYLSLDGQRLRVRVDLLIDGFPTLSDPFGVVSLPGLEEGLGAEALDGFGSREAWLRVDPVQHDRVVAHPAVEGSLLDDSRARLRALRSDALAQGTNGVLQFNALTLVLFSVTVFLLIHQLAAGGRAREFGVLRAMGLSARQSFALLGFEGALLLLLGLLAGAAVGLGLSHIMIPFLSQALAGSLGGVAIERILVDWPAVARLYGVLLAIYGSALTLFLLVLMRTRAHWGLGIGDE